MKKDYTIKKNSIKRQWLVKQRKGVTMMETVVALGILSFGIGTSLVLMAGSIAFSQTSEQSIVVVNLAREGMEIVRSIREFAKTADPFLVLPGGTSTFFDAGVDGYYVVDVINKFNLQTSIGQTNFDNINNCSVCKLYQGTSDKRYSHNTGEVTIFRRAIKITSSSANEKTVVSKVYWSEHGREHTFVLEDHLTNW